MDNSAIYKFLDEYCGTDVDVIRGNKVFNSNGRNSFIIKSRITKEPILYFHYKISNDEIKIYRSESLCKTISSFFNIDVEDATNIVKNWFGNRHGLSKVGDLLKFV